MTEKLARDYLIVHDQLNSLSSSLFWIKEDDEEEEMMTMVMPVVSFVGALLSG